MERRDYGNSRNPSAFLNIAVVDHAVEDHCGWQLLLVSDHHELASAINRSEGIPREHLQSLVKEDDLEWKRGRFQVRADRQRTPHPARLESDESIRHTSEKRSQRQVSLLLVDFGGMAGSSSPRHDACGWRRGFVAPGTRNIEPEYGEFEDSTQATLPIWCDDF